MGIVVVGSVALDTVETPAGKVVEALGGSATYFSLAARHYAPVSVVAVVGTDFPTEHIELLRSREIGLNGLSVEPGETFRWSGRYSENLNECVTLDTRLNVFGAFRPQLPESCQNEDVVFLANIDPDLQLDVLRQTRKPWLTAMDTMNFWIQSKRDRVVEVMRSVDVVLINEGELRQLTGIHNLIAAARELLALGPTALVLKKGEHGAVALMDGAYFGVPAYPLEVVRDPTGAGDSFAGAFVGALARDGQLTSDSLRRAVVRGSVVASYAVEDFSVRRLLCLRQCDLDKRYADFREFARFE